jgi:aspartate aminotransferase-like enzyme
MGTARDPRPILVSPGPVSVLEGSLGQLQPLHHRSGAFRVIVRETEGMLKTMFRTSSSVHLLTASGTGAMEAAVANVTVPGSSVLVVSGGKFGQRWAEICDAYECRTDLLEIGRRAAVDVDAIVRHIDRSRPEAIALTHVESSTGLLFPLGELLARLRGHRSTVIVDAISSLGAEDLDMDAWGIDVALGASQKSLAAPAGVSFIAVGERALDLVGRRRRGVYYFDLARSAAAGASAETPFTPAIGTIQIMHRSLALMKELGFDEMRSRHRRAAAAFLAAAGHLSLEPYSESPSSAVQVLTPPPDCRADEILARLEREGFIAAGGQGEIGGRVIRTGFLGLFDVGTLERLVSALGKVLAECGSSVDTASARECMREYGVVSSPFVGGGSRYLSD